MSTITENLHPSASCNGFSVRIATFFVLIFSLALPGHVYANEDWDFTPADYKKLNDAGKKITIGKSSEWVPKKVQTALLKTLNKVLDPKTKPTNTNGVNIKDFYHFHIVCKLPCSDKKIKDKNALGKKVNEILGKGLGGNWYDRVTAKNLKSFTKSMAEATKVLGEGLSTILKDCKNCFILSHTFEFSGPKGMKPGDPRRNIMAGLDKGKPFGYVSPGNGNEVNVHKEYCYVYQIAFLIDKNGVVHAVPGSIASLSTVTGKPMD